MDTLPPDHPFDRDTSLTAIEQWCDRVRRLAGTAGAAVDAESADLLREELAVAERLLRGQRAALIAARTAAERAPRVAESEQARIIAEAANRAKTQLLATVSHELRTPLAAIGGYADLLALGIRGPLSVDQLRDVDRISRAQEHMASLLDDLLLHFRLGLGAQTVAITRAQVTDLLMGLRTFIGPQADARGISIDIHPPSSDCIVNADVDRARQILINLITNSVKYAPANSRVDVEVVDGGTMVAIEVRDQGAGISADQLQSIFEPFVQLDPTAAGRTGVGLGLSISRKLAELMGGRLDARSTPGEGSCFALSLAKAP